MAKNTGGSGGRGTGRRILLLAGIAGIVWFAVQGGEYATPDLIRQRARMATLHARVNLLQHTVDSLNAWKKAIETDPAVQERIAREEFGMVRGNKELLYRLVQPSADTVHR